MTKVLHTDAAPAAIGPYIQGVDLGNMVLTSGQIPVNLPQVKFLRTSLRKLVNLWTT